MAKGGKEVAGVELATMIQALRSELTEAMDDGADKRLRFVAESVELELSVSVTRSADAKAGVKFWVVDAGASGRVEKSNVQRFKLKLSPKVPGAPGDVLIAEETERPRK